MDAIICFLAETGLIRIAELKKKRVKKQAQSQTATDRSWQKDKDTLGTFESVPG